MISYFTAKESLNIRVVKENRGRKILSWRMTRKRTERPIYGSVRMKLEYTDA